MIELLLGLGLSVVGVVVTGRSVRHRRRARASQTWPTTPGAITAATLTETTERDADGDLVTTYHFHLRYDYTVGGVAYTGRRVDHGEPSTTHRSRARRWEDAYHPGNAVTVYHDPADPAEAVLEPRATAGTTAGIFIGAALALWGLVMAVGGTGEAAGPEAQAPRAVQATHAAAALPAGVFASTPEGTPGGAGAFVPFHLVYPREWEPSPEAVENGYFLQVSGRPAGQPDSAVTDYLAAFPFTFEGAAETALAGVADGYAEWLRTENGYANLRVVDRGATEVGPHAAFGLAFDDLGGPGGDAYGRIVLVPAVGPDSIPGSAARRGVGLFLIGYGEAGAERAEGELAAALSTFRLGAPTDGAPNDGPDLHDLDALR